MYKLILTQEKFNLFKIFNNSSWRGYPYVIRSNGMIHFLKRCTSPSPKSETQKRNGPIRTIYRARVYGPYPVNREPNPMIFLFSFIKTKMRTTEHSLHCIGFFDKAISTPWSMLSVTVSQYFNY